MEIAETEMQEVFLADLLARWPQGATVFWQYKMHCPGCPFSPFHTIQEACQAHQVSEEDFLVALKGALSSPG